MEPASILAIIILIVAILILLFYYLQSTNNPVYKNIHAQASGISNRVAQEEYVSNISDKVSGFSDKFIEDWNLATNKDLDKIIERYDALNNDFSSYKKSNDTRVSDLEKRVDKISEELSELKD